MDNLRRKSTFVAIGGLFLLLWGRSLPAAEANHAVDGFRISYPDSWFSYPDTTKQSGEPVTITNFPQSAYIHGGIVPPNGARIRIERLATNTDVFGLLDQRAKGADNVARSNALQGLPAMLTYRVDGMQHVVRVFKVGSVLLIAELDYNIGDAGGPSYEGVLADIITNTQAQ